MALSRLALVACFVALLVSFTPWRMAALGGLEFALYLALFAATKVASRHPDPVKASERLRWQSDLLMFLLVTNACWLAVQIRLYDDPIMRVEAALLAICVLLFAALRLHMSRFSYALGVAPPVGTLIWIAIDWSDPLAINHYALAMLLFVAAVLLVTSRQQATDRSLTQAMRDLTRQNAALALATEDARAASQAKTDLLAVASHEIRTPLNAVLGFAQALRSETLTPGQANLARGIVEGGQQLTRLLDGVLNLSHLEGRGDQLNLTAVDLRDVIGSAMRVWGPHARDLGLSFTFTDADPTLSFCVMADAARVEQALVALISNAMDATPSNGRVEVRLAGAAKGDTLSVLIEVADAGPRVPPEDRPRIFAAFDQTGRGRVRGTSGVGLAVCARNLALMAGEVGVADLGEGNDPVEGAVFWFAFDAAVAARTPVGPVGAPPLAEVIRILAAEDNPANRNVLAALLGSTRVSLVFAEDGAQALDAWRSQPFDLILMDVNMPVLGGREAVREIRRAEPEGVRIPIWMLTANAFDEDVANYLADGADGVLRKPIDLAELFDLLARTAGDLGQD
ncbi:MAG: response regulator [Phenylobacterium sp.]|uniref:response regulator n=1 Tax=Phenylobacterium sp. TaxID=1871053 RepID=UPI003BB4D795